MNRSPISLSAVLSMACVSGAFAQGATRSFTIDGSDLAYTSNPGYTYEIATVAVTDAANFRADASGIVTTGPRGPGAVGYALFPVGVPVPEVFRWQDHRDDANAVAARNEGNANARGSVRLTNRAGGPLVADVYQLVVAPADARDRRGDFTLDVTLTGGTFVVLAPAPPSSAFTGATTGASRLLLVDVRGVIREQGQTSLVTRSDQTAFSLGEDGTSVVMSTMGAPGMMGDLYGWAEITGFYASDDSADRSMRGVGFQVGADVALSPSLIAGLSAGTTDLNTDTGGTQIDGDVVYVQPYLAYRGAQFDLQASLLYGRGDFDQSGAGGDGTGETELTALTLSGSTDRALAPDWTLSPIAELVYGREETTGTGGALTGSDTVDFYQVSLGARLTHSVAGGEVFGGLHLDYQQADSDTVLAGDILINDGVTGRLEMGGRWQPETGWGVDTSIEIGGLGGDFGEVSGALRITFRF